MNIAALTDFAWNVATGIAANGCYEQLKSILGMALVNKAKRGEREAFEHDMQKVLQDAEIRQMLERLANSSGNINNQISTGDISANNSTVQIGNIQYNK